MLFSRLVVVGLVGFVLTANAAFAQEAQPPAALEGVSFADPMAGGGSFSSGLNISLTDEYSGRFINLAPTASRADNDTRSYELSLVAQRGTVGLPIDVAIAQRATFGMNENGDMRRGTGREVRFGHGLARRHKGPRSSWDQPAWYVFAASDDEALTWAPQSSGPGGRRAGFSLQDRVEIGDRQAGITYEAGNFQASLAYVERQISSTTGAQTFYSDENFAGLTVTFRH